MTTKAALQMDYDELQEKYDELQEKYDELQLGYDRLEEAYSDIECANEDVAEIIKNRIQLSTFIYWLKLENLYSDKFEEFVDYYMKYRNQEGVV